jgi:hypothetical protein
MRSTVSTESGVSISITKTDGLIMSRQVINVFFENREGRIIYTVWQSADFRKVVAGRIH